MGMQQNFLDIFKIVCRDEELLRLLHYPSQNDVKKVADPLSDKLPNILDMSVKDRLKITDKSVFKIAKDEDLSSDEICRVYIYPSRRSATSNPEFANQQVIFDILVHEKFENGDLRSMRIFDRLNELFNHKLITGIGKMVYNDGQPIPSPKNYIGYRHVFKIVEFQRR